LASRFPLEQLNRIAFYPVRSHQSLFPVDSIAFDAVTDTNNPIHQIYTIKADGSDLRQITFGQNSDRPRWSPDGKNIIFTNYTDTGIELDVMKPDT
jgi:Tol biopolymer transport system component